jgi:hypothetical protein
MTAEPWQRCEGALAFLAAHAGIIAIGAIIALVIFTGPLLRWLAPLGWQDDAGWHRGQAPTHDHPGRDSDRQRGIHSNHIGGN